MELKLDRAGKLVSGLAGERVRWEKTVEVHTHTSMHTHAYARRHAHLWNQAILQIVYFFLMQDLEMDMGYLVGDCLLAAAFLSYMGPFLSNYRDELLTRIWIKQVIPLLLTIVTFFTLPSFCTSLFFPYTHTLSVVQGVGGSMLSRIQLCCFPLQSDSRAWLEHPGSSLRCFLHWEWSYRHPRQPVSPHQTDLPALLWPTDRL